MAKLAVFVACPYTLFPMDDYKAALAAASKSYDVVFRFADEQITNQQILAKVTAQIRDADFSLFDITGWNPNVTLELGIAVGLGRRYFILLNSKIDQNQDVPSDIRGIDRLQYQSNSELEAKLVLLIKQELPHETSRSDLAFETVKSSINDALRKTPGLRLKGLVEATKQEGILVQATIRAMVANNELKTRGLKKGMSYFTRDTDLRKLPKNG